MLGFSEYLQSFMKSNSISMVELAKETNIDRTVIYRYVKGTRVPSDVDIVLQMAEAMQMSVSEKRHLLEEYDKLVLGETMVYSYQYIRQLLQSLSELDKSILTGNQWRSVREVKMDVPIIELSSKEEIVSYILDLFQYIATKNSSGKIVMIMQPIYDSIQRFIPQIFRQSDMHIEQLVCMEQNINQSYKNLEVFQGILPLLFSMPQYDVYYYYDSLNNHINSMTSMPNIIVVQDYVVQFDYNMEHGSVIKNAVYADIMYKQYAMLRKEVRRLLLRGDNPGLMSDFVPKMTKNVSCLFGQLCMGNCMDRKILERCIYSIDGREEFIDLLLTRNGNWDGVTQLEGGELGNLISYGTQKEMEEFMKTGRIKEFPEALYEPLSMKERKIVLERMIYLARQKIVHYYFVSDKVDLPEGIHIYWFREKKRFALNRITKKDILQVTIDEQSIYRTFQLYLEYLEKKGMVYSEEETLESLLKLQRKFTPK